MTLTAAKEVVILEAYVESHILAVEFSPEVCKCPFAAPTVGGLRLQGVVGDSTVHVLG